MRKASYFLILSLTFAPFFMGVSQAYAQTIEVDCSTNLSGNTACQSQSSNAITATAVLAGSGKINKVTLRNLESAPVLIQNQTNTDTMTLYGEIDNRGRAQDLTIDMQPHYNSTTAPNWMLKASNSGSTLIVADSINNLNISVNGYVGGGGKSLSQLCGDRALLATQAATTTTCALQNASGIPTGYFDNPTCDPSIIDINTQIASKVSGNNGLCSSSDILSTISTNAPANFCPADHFYLAGRDGANPPLLNTSGTSGDLSEFIGKMSAEGPVRLRFLNKCVKEKVFFSCTISGSVSISAPTVSFNTTTQSIVTSTVTGVIGLPLLINPLVTPDANNPGGAPITGCKIDPTSPNAASFPSTLSVDPLTCAITGTPTVPMNPTTFSVIATNIAGNSPDGSFTLNVVTPTAQHNTAVDYESDTPSGVVASTSQVTYNQVVNDIDSELTADCAAEYASIKSTGTLPDKTACYAANISLPATCPPDSLQVLETNTQVRDVNNYYGAPSLTYSNPTVNFRQGQVLAVGVGTTPGTAIKPTSLASANAGTPITGCQSATDVNSGADLLTLAPGLVIDPITCVITGTLPAYEISMREFSVTATDMSGTSNPATFMMAVMPVATIATLTLPAAPVNAVQGQALSVPGTLVLAQNATPIVGCRLEPNSDNILSFPSTLAIDPATCTISGVPTDLMPPTVFTLQATNATGVSNSAQITISVVATAPVPVFNTSTTSAGTCAYPTDGEVFETYTQDHIIEPYTPDITVSAGYEELSCMYGNCPGVTTTYTFSDNSSVNFSIGSGESGSFGGQATVFAYDIALSAQASTSFSFANGTNGANGSVDMAVPTVTKYCAKVLDARGLDGQNILEGSGDPDGSTGGNGDTYYDVDSGNYWLNSNGNWAQTTTLPTSPKVPLVNFHKSTYSPMNYTLPVIVPGTAFPQRTQNQAIGVFKKMDSSVRQFIINQFIEPRFQ